MKNIFFLFAVSLLSLQFSLVAQPYPNNSKIRTQVENNHNGKENNDDDDDDDNDNNDNDNDYYKQRTANNINRTNGSPNPLPSTPYRSTIIDNTQTQKKERTLSILKPDAVRNRHIGDIIKRIEDKGLHIVGIKMLILNKNQVSQFYNMHRDRPFFNDLVQFMSSGPVVIMVLEGNHAIAKSRQLMGATDPNKAEQGSIRADFGESVTHNAIHGSDSEEAAIREIQFFFSPNELYTN